MVLPTTITSTPANRKIPCRRLLIVSFCYFYILLIFDSKSINSFSRIVDAAPVAGHQLFDGFPSSSTGSLGSSPAAHRDAFSAVNMIEFMKRYGYLEKGSPDAEALYSEHAISDAIKTVQKYGGLTETGYLDEQTRKLMASPRCGVADIQRSHPPTNRKSSYHHHHRRRQRRFVVGARPWMKRRITYFLANWSPKVGQQEMALDMRAAFDEWAKYSRLKFVQVFTPDADIIVGFGSAHHGDNYPFDGPGNILAHAYYPYEMGSLGGDIHFDNDESWTRNSSDPMDVNFLSVAVHELGHSLGLGHSPVHNSIMFPYYKAAAAASSSTGHPEGHQLGYDDVLAMYNLYILRASTLLDEDDDGADNGEDSATEATTTASLIPSTTRGITGDDEEMERIWPRTNPTTTERNPPAALPTREAAQQPSNVTYHFHGDYETVDAHKKRFNYPENTSPMDNPTTTARTTLFSTWWTVQPRRRTSTNNGWDFGNYWSGGGRWKNNNRLSSGGDDGNEVRTRTTVPIDRYDVYHHRPPPPPADDICLGNFDAITAINEDVFVFRNKFVWRFDANLAPVRGYPIPIKQQLPGLPLGGKDEEEDGEQNGIVDAAYQRQTDGAVVLFANQRLWIINGSDFQLTRNSEGMMLPPEAHHHHQEFTIWDLGLPRSLSKIDGIFVWPKNQKVYLFAGQEFWRFSDDKWFWSLEPGYPKSISRWHGIPFNIDGVMVHPQSRKTLFFKNNSYWQFNDNWVRPALGYPKLVRTLFNC